MIIKAFAKINLTLDIVGFTSDNFHALRSVMAPISLCDMIEINKSDKILFTCDDKSLETEGNICLKAAKAFFDAIGIDGGCDIKLNKKIPYPAGLGGGSADAAAVLRALNELYDYPLSVDSLFTLASKIGSDVPLCLLCKTALCEGKGDIMTEIDMPHKLNLVIAIGNSRLSTPEVYRKYDSMKLPIRNDSDEFLKNISNREAMLQSLGNAFEPVADELAPETKLLREMLISSGAESARLSGSGPSVYGIFADEESAYSASDELIKKGFSAYIAKTI